jgi:signal peptidase I
MKPKSKLRQYGESIAIAAIIALSVKSLVFASYTIPSSSMEPTLLVGDYLFANRLSYVMKVPLTDIVVLTLGEPKRGDIIIFRYPEDRSKDFVKRVIAKKGDVVEIKDKVVFVNGQRVDIAAAHFTDSRMIPGSLSPRDNFGPVTVPEDSYFVMGDNRDNSADSRFWGFLKKEDLVGKAEIIYFSRDSKATDPLGYVRWHRLGSLVR